MKYLDLKSTPGRKWFLKTMPRPDLFLPIFAFSQHSIDFNVIWTWIVGVEGEHADHSTTTTAQQ